MAGGRGGPGHGAGQRGTPGGHPGRRPAVGVPPGRDPHSGSAMHGATDKMVPERARGMARRPLSGGRTAHRPTRSSPCSTARRCWPGRCPAGPHGPTVPLVGRQREDHACLEPCCSVTRRRRAPSALRPSALCPSTQCPSAQCPSATTRRSASSMTQTGAPMRTTTVARRRRRPLARGGSSVPVPLMPTGTSGTPLNAAVAGCAAVKCGRSAVPGSGSLGEHDHVAAGCEQPCRCQVGAAPDREGRAQQAADRGPHPALEPVVGGGGDGGPSPGGQRRDQRGGVGVRTVVGHDHARAACSAAAPRTRRPPVPVKTPRQSARRPRAARAGAAAGTAARTAATTATTARSLTGSPPGPVRPAASRSGQAGRRTRQPAARVLGPRAAFDHRLEQVAERRADDDGDHVRGG